MPHAQSHAVRRRARATAKAAHVAHCTTHQRRPIFRIASLAIALLLFAAAPACAGVASVGGSQTDNALGLVSSLCGLLGFGAVAELRTKRNAKLAELEAIQKKADTEKRDLTEDEARSIDEGFTAIEAIDAEIVVAEKGEQRKGRLTKLLESRRAPASPPPRAHDPGHDPDTNDVMLNPSGAGYSFLRAATRLADRVPMDGVEKEVSDEIAHRSGKPSRGFYLPLNLRVDTSLLRRERRSLDTTAAAGALVTQQSSTMIDLLVNKMRLFQLGAVVLQNLTGTIDIPKKLTRGQAYWVAEGGAPTGSNATIGQLEMAPTTVGCYTDITRRTMSRASMSMEQFTLADLTQVMALAQDAAGISGTGSNNQPLGLLNNPDINTVEIGTNGGPITHAKLIEMETLVGIANADVDTMAYLTNARVRGDMKQILRFPDSSSDRVILADNNTANGYPVAISNQVPSDLTKGTAEEVCSATIFGDFGQVIVGFWSAVDVMVDPYALATSGGTRIILLQDTQLLTRHVESFQKCVDLTTSV